MRQATARPIPQARAAIDPARVLAILEKHRGSRGEVIAVFEDIQAACGYLPEPALRLVSERTGRQLVDLYGVATFYRAFSLTPRGTHVVSVCLGTACHVRGAPAVVEEFERQLGIQAGATTPDGAFTLETVNCLGACALGPVVFADGHYFTNVDTTRVRSILKKVRTGLDGPPGQP